MVDTFFTARVFCSQACRSVHTDNDLLSITDIHGFTKPTQSRVGFRPVQAWTTLCRARQGHPALVGSPDDAELVPAHGGPDAKALQCSEPPTGAS
jgi:hypothetical protein